ncbi:hypothetical protein SBC1_16400 [Caballeronia sp. SBC1]|nr:hypothetical protein SBC2_17750 [Caballeronia sp. SBC2]QIN61646.1 hypothetical protein SBC1_16400 [Caballeronia sp. SBC1]
MSVWFATTAFNRLACGMRNIAARAKRIEGRKRKERSKPA